MNPLLLNLVIVSIICIIYQAIPNKDRVTTSIFLLATFCCLLYIHSMVDIYSVADLEIYEDYFYRAKQASFKDIIVNRAIDTRIEIGYGVFNKLVSYISTNFRIFLLIYSSVLLFLYYKSFINTSPFIALSIMLLLVGPFNQSIYVVRQHLAAAILLYSFTLIKERKIIQFTLILFIAYSLHRSAIVFILVYILYGLSKKNLIRALAVIAILSFTIFGIIMTIFVDTLGSYGNYLDDEWNALNYKTSILSGFYLLLFVYFLKEHVFNEGINKFSLIMLFLYFILSLSGLGASAVVGRMTIYFSIGLLSAIPVMLTYIKNTALKVIVFFIIFGLQFYAAFMGSSATKAIESFRIVQLF